MKRNLTGHQTKGYSPNEAGFWRKPMPVTLCA